MSVKRFVVYPGYVSSRNDWDRHYISARQLMDLYRVHPEECVVIRDERDLMGRRGDDLDRLMPLCPQWGVDYMPVTDAERARYPLDLDAPDPPGTLALEQRLLGGAAARDARSPRGLRPTPKAPPQPLAGTRPAPADVEGGTLRA